MKKISVLLLIIFFSTLFAEKKIIIHNSDGTSYTRDISKIDSITFEEYSTSTGTIEYAITGEDIPYQNLIFFGNLSSAKIDYAYMLVANPGLHHIIRPVGSTLHGRWAVDLLGNPAHLGYLEVESGSYESPAKITISKGGDWDNVTDKGGLVKLREKNVAFLFGGSFVDAEGTSYRFEIREPLPTFSVIVEEYPTDVNGYLGTKLHVSGGDTLLATFHPHIDHALDVFDENAIDFTVLEKENGVIVFSDEMNAEAIDGLGRSIALYSEIVSQIDRGDRWDVNVIPQ